MTTEGTIEVLAEPVGPGIWAIDTGYVRPQLDAAHLLVSAGEAAFVDTGVRSSLPRLLGALEELGIDRTAVRYVLLTHIHLDHAGCAGALMAALPQAALVVHPRGARHMADPTKLIAGSVAVYGETAFAQMYGEIMPVDAGRILATEDGHTLPLGERTLTFLHTPGHAKHHHCIFDTAAGAVFTGDTFGLAYRELTVAGRPFIFPTTTPVHFDPDAAHASIERILSRSPQVAYLTHYSAVTGLPQLAADLHTGLDAFVRLTEEATSQHALEAALMAHLSAQLDAHGDTHTPAERQAILGMDITLNAQGLWFWREHRR